MVNLVMFLARDEYPHEFAKPLLKSIFKTSDFKTLAKNNEYISVSMRTQYHKDKLVSRMIADYPNPCEFFKEMMFEFYSDHNQVGNQYGDITLTFSGFSPEIIQYLHTQNKNTATHKFFFDKNNIVIVLNQKYFENNNQLLKNSFDYCSADPGQYALYKAFGWLPTQSYVIQKTAGRHAALVQDNRVPGKNIDPETTDTNESKNNKPTQTPLPEKVNTHKPGPVEVQTNR